MSYETTFYTFQNSYKGSIILQYGKNGAALQFVPVLNPVSPKDIKAGMKIYNYDASKWFTITPDEMIILRQLITSLIQNGLQGVNYKVGTVECSEKYGISVSHFPKDGISRLQFSRFPDKADPNKMHYMIKYTFSQNNQVAFDLGLEIGSHGLLLFNEYLQQQFNYMSTYNASKRALYESKNPQGNNNYNNNGGGNYNKQNNNGGGNYRNNNYNNNGGGNYNNNNGNSYNNNNNVNANSNSTPTTAPAGGSVASLLG